jgi:hypothetical protein
LNASLVGPKAIYIIRRVGQTRAHPRRRMRGCPGFRFGKPGAFRDHRRPAHFRLRESSMAAPRSPFEYYLVNTPWPAVAFVVKVNVTAATTPLRLHFSAPLDLWRRISTFPHAPFPPLSAFGSNTSTKSRRLRPVFAPKIPANSPRMNTCAKAAPNPRRMNTYRQTAPATAFRMNTYAEMGWGGRGSLVTLPLPFPARASLPHGLLARRQGFRAGLRRPRRGVARQPRSDRADATPPSLIYAPQSFGGLGIIPCGGAAGFFSQ